MTGVYFNSLIHKKKFTKELLILLKPKTLIYFSLSTLETQLGGGDQQHQES